METAGHEIVINYASYRRITDFPGLIGKYPDFDLYILQAGIVDLYPRPLSYKYVISKNSFFIKYIYNKAWSTEKEIENAIKETCKLSTSKFVWINVAPVNRLQEIETPGAAKAIMTVNTILERMLKTHANSFELEIYQKLVSQEKYESLLHETDSHLNIKGNAFYAEHLLSFLSPLLSDKIDI